MSGRTRLALCATAATLMASGALLPLVDTSGWLVQAAILLALQSGVGALARRVPLARPVTVSVQALVTLLLLTLVSGWTGYVMVWDAFGEVIAREAARMLDALPILSEPISRAFTRSNVSGHSPNFSPSSP